MLTHREQRVLSGRWRITEMISELGDDSRPGQVAALVVDNLDPQQLLAQLPQRVMSAVVRNVERVRECVVRVLYRERGLAMLRRLRVEQIQQFSNPELRRAHLGQ